MQDSQIKVDSPTGAITVYPGPDGVVCVVGSDSTVATLLMRPGQLTVKVDRGAMELWRHTFTYVTGAVESENGRAEPVPIQRRPRGRPRIQREPVPAPATMDTFGQ